MTIHAQHVIVSGGDGSVKTINVGRGCWQTLNSQNGFICNFYIECHFIVQQTGVKSIKLIALKICIQLSTI